MLLGSLVYLIGIWRTCPLFSGKGYFLGVLVISLAMVTLIMTGESPVAAVSASWNQQFGINKYVKSCCWARWFTSSVSGERARYSAVKAIFLACW
jgi:uncharacterized membrane protein YiaA